VLHLLQHPKHTTGKKEKKKKEETKKNIEHIKIHTIAYIQWSND